MDFRTRIWSYGWERPLCPPSANCTGDLIAAELDSNPVFKPEITLCASSTVSYPHIFVGMVLQMNRNFSENLVVIEKNGHFLRSVIITFVFCVDYPVKSFDGSKRVIISTTSLLGGKNPFLGMGYIVVGCIVLMLGIVFLVIHIKYGKRYDGRLHFLTSQRQPR